MPPPKNHDNDANEDGNGFQQYRLLFVETLKRLDMQYQQLSQSQQQMHQQQEHAQREAFDQLEERLNLLSSQLGSLKTDYFVFRGKVAVVASFAAAATTGIIEWVIQAFGRRG
jgi:hypothetical protein